MQPTSPRKRGGRVRVRGTCTAGHVTETVSDPGRVTWHGQCADEACSLPVYAKRVPKDVRPPEVDGAQKPPKGDDDETVREVSFDVPQPKRGRGQPRLPDEPEQPPAGEQPVPAPAAQLGGGDPIVIPHVLPDRREPERTAPAGQRGGGRLVGRLRRSGERERQVTEFRHPLDW